jgi:23S rRNA pseudouridine2605 synthase
MSDEMGRKCVAELVSEIEERIFPVGRLDRDSEGLLLFTNDGEFANMMTHPSMHISKTYRVTVKPAADEAQLVELSSGVVIDGKKTMPASVQVMSEDSDRSVLQITIHEGRNRQIRKMCEAVGLETIRLKRISMGSLKLGTLSVGKYRELKKEEVAALKRAAQKSKSANSQGNSKRK